MSEIKVRTLKDQIKKATFEKSGYVKIYWSNGFVDIVTVDEYKSIMEG